MKLGSRAKISLLIVGDVIALYASLVLTLALRYGGDFSQELVSVHLVPFSSAFALWLIVFYVAGLYDLGRLRNNLDFIKTLGLTLLVNLLLTIALFYLIPAFGITPKTNLFIFASIFSVLETWWRRSWNVRATFREGLNRVLIIGTSKSTEEIIAAMHNNPQLGYELALRIGTNPESSETKAIRSLVQSHNVNLVAIPRSVRSDATLVPVFYELLASGITIVDMPTLYEMVFRKVPLAEIDEEWFIENRIGQRKFYDDLKRGIEFVSALVLFILLLPLELVIAILVKATSPDRTVCTQVRVGEHGNPYPHHKFRTMKSCSEKNGPEWKAADGSRIVDPRLTRIGRILAYSHLDELPQLWNILAGEMSFVGPRPERPEFVKLLAEKIPYYHIRHLVRPGVTGWAQINYSYGGSVEGTYEKLQYDLYYLKNRSLIVDGAILIKTLKTIFVTPQQ